MPDSAKIIKSYLKTLYGEKLAKSNHIRMYINLNGNYKSMRPKNYLTFFRNFEKSLLINSHY